MSRGHSPSLEREAASLAERLIADQSQLPALDAPAPLSLVLAVIDRLKSAADDYWSIDPRVSLDVADLIVAIGQRRASPATVALGQMARGDALKLLGRTLEASDALQLAGRLFREAGDEIGWARTRIGLLYVSTMLNSVTAALADAERARAIFTQHGDLDRLVRLDLQTAYVHNYLGASQQALGLYLSALATAQALGQPGEAYFGRLYANIGSAYHFLGESQLARDYYERARALFDSGGELLNLTTVETNLALLLQGQGHFRQALQLLNGSLERVAGRSDIETTRIKSYVAECYLALNRPAEALDLAQQVVADYRQSSDAFELGRALLRLASAQASLRQLSAGQTALDEAEASFSALGAAPWVSLAQVRRGRLQLGLGEPGRALAAAQAAAAALTQAGQIVSLASAALLQGQAALALLDPAQAMAQGLVTLKIARRSRLPDLRYSAHLLLGQAAEALKARTRARRHYRAAAATTERVQRGLTITLRPGFLEDKDEALRRLTVLYLEDNQPGPALEALEQSKSQLLLGYLTNREALRWDRAGARSRGLLEELEQLRAEHEQFYRLAHEPPSADPRVPHAAVDGQHELAARERRMRAITEQLYFESRESQSLPAASVSIDALRQTLAERTLLIEYFDDGTRLWAFALSRQGLDAHPLPASAAVVARLVVQLQINIAAALGAASHSAAMQPLTGHARRLLQRLHAALIAPLGLQPADWDRLVIVPYGPLHYLPFNLLFDGDRHLVERHEVVILPAGALAARAAPAAPAGALILAHSHAGRLPHTQSEAAMVQRIIGGRLAVEAAANRAVLAEPPTQVLHIAAHGRYRLDQPDLSYIQLADGQLYTDDLLQNNLDYELVTLSGCETGRAQAAGGELIGLGRGFLYAGAGALIASLWSVSDAATAQLMAHLYIALRAGRSKAAALRGAQQALLSEDPQLHPAFWGAFQLIGDARPLSI